MVCLPPINWCRISSTVYRLSTYLFRIVARPCSWHGDHHHIAQRFRFGEETVTFSGLQRFWTGQEMIVFKQTKHLYGLYFLPVKNPPFFDGFPGFPLNPYGLPSITCNHMKPSIRANRRFDIGLNHPKSKINWKKWIQQQNRNFHKWGYPIAGRLISWKIHL